jgi:hypothetical protein
MRNIEQNKYVTEKDRRRDGEALIDERAKGLAVQVQQADPFAGLDDTNQI